MAVKGWHIREDLFCLVSEGNIRSYGVDVAGCVAVYKYLRCCERSSKCSWALCLRKEPIIDGLF